MRMKIRGPDGDETDYALRSRKPRLGLCMHGSDESLPVPRPRSGAAFALRAAWACMRLPLLALLVILEPLVRFALGAFALVLVLTALFFELVSSSAIPFWGMLRTAVGCVALLTLYERLIRGLS